MSIHTCRDQQSLATTIRAIAHLPEHASPSDSCPCLPCLAWPRAPGPAQPCLVMPGGTCRTLSCPITRSPTELRRAQRFLPNHTRPDRSVPNASPSRATCPVLLCTTSPRHTQPAQPSTSDPWHSYLACHTEPIGTTTDLPSVACPTETHRAFRNRQSPVFPRLLCLLCLTLASSRPAPSCLPCLRAKLGLAQLALPALPSRTLPVPSSLSTPALLNQTATSRNLHSTN